MSESANLINEFINSDGDFYEYPTFGQMVDEKTTKILY